MNRNSFDTDSLPFFRRTVVTRPVKLWLLILAGFDDQIRLWNVATQREVMVLKELGIGSASVLFSPDGQFLTAGCRDGSVRFWRAPMLAEVDGVERTRAGEMQTSSKEDSK